MPPLLQPHAQIEDPAADPRRMRRIIAEVRLPRRARTRKRTHKRTPAYTRARVQLTETAGLLPLLRFACVYRAFFITSRRRIRSGTWRVCHTSYSFVSTTWSKTSRTSRCWRRCVHLLDNTHTYACVCLQRTHTRRGLRLRDLAKRHGNECALRSRCDPKPFLTLGWFCRARCSCRLSSRHSC